MKTPTNPTGVMLVGFLFICMILIPATALQQQSSQEQLNKLINQHQNSPLGTLKVGAETINFPWSSQQDRHIYPNLPGSSSTPPKREEIVMDNSNPTANVQDLFAMNRQVKRDLVFKDSQKTDQEDEGINHQDISVSGLENGETEDEAAETGRQRQEDSIWPGEPDNNKMNYAGNYLSIDVHDISVSAINTMQGGSAVATSNIIIEPVQIIVCPPEVGIKLK